MKVVLFFSRVTFICNIAFLVFVIFRWMEKRKSLTGATDIAIAVPFVKELIIILGFTAIVTNLIMNIIYLIFLLSGKLEQLPQWLIIANVLFLLLQFYYFFLFNYQR